MKKIIAIFIVLFCTSVSVAQQKSTTFSTTFRHVVRSYPTKSDVIEELIGSDKWKMDTSFRLSSTNEDKKRWANDVTFRADWAKFFMAFRPDGKCQMYVGGGKTLSGTYRVDAIKDAFGKQKTLGSNQEIEKRKKEAMDKIVDKSVGHKDDSYDYFLSIKVPESAQELKFEIQIMVSQKMMLYLEQADQVTQWLGQESK